MRDLLDELVLLISKILIYASYKLFSLISNQMHAPGLWGFFNTKYHRNGYQETCILFLNLLLTYIVYFMLRMCLCLEFPACIKGSIMLFHCILVSRGGCFKMNSVGNLLSHSGLLCIKNIYS